MRNCFVPGCDHFCKTHNCVQRKMFFAPKEMFEKWKEKLANKREFKKNDRVCERHFEADQIIEYWENKINGVIHKTKREKPKLISCAIPTLNLPNWNEFTSPNHQKKHLDKSKILQAQIIKRVSNSDLKKEQTTPIKKLKTDITKNEASTKPENTQQPTQKTPVKSVQEPVDEESLELFENLYDEVHDVTLPNTLFGINRCPDRQFIVFNEFNIKTMGYNKFLFIDSSLNCKAFINGKIITSKLEKKNCNTEFISDWLDKIEKE